MKALLRAVVSGGLKINEAERMSNARISSHVLSRKRNVVATLSVNDLEVSHGRTQVLFGVSFVVPDGGLVCVMGRNGVGKSTLRNTIMGVLTLKRGSISYEGRDLAGLKPNDRIKLGIGATFHRIIRAFQTCRCEKISPLCWKLRNAQLPLTSMMH